MFACVTWVSVPVPLCQTFHARASRSTRWVATTAAGSQPLIQYQAVDTAWDKHQCQLECMLRILAARWDRAGVTAEHMATAAAAHDKPWALAFLAGFGVDVAGTEAWLAQSSDTAATLDPILSRIVAGSKHLHSRKGVASDETLRGVLLAVCEAMMLAGASQSWTAIANPVQTSELGGLYPVTEADGARFLSAEGAALRHMVGAREDLGYVAYTLGMGDIAAAAATAATAGMWFTACKELAEYQFLDWRFVFGVPLALYCNPSDTIAVCLPCVYWSAALPTVFEANPEKLEVREHTEDLGGTIVGGKNGGSKRGRANVDNIDCFVASTCKSWGPTPSAPSDSGDGTEPLVQPRGHKVLYGIAGDMCGRSSPSSDAQSSSESTAAVASILHDCDHCLHLSDVPTASGPGVLEAKTGINWTSQCAFKIMSRMFPGEDLGNLAAADHSIADRHRATADAASSRDDVNRTASAPGEVREQDMRAMFSETATGAVPMLSDASTVLANYVQTCRPGGDPSKSILGRHARGPAATSSKSVLKIKVGNSGAATTTIAGVIDTVAEVRRQEGQATTSAKPFELTSIQRAHVAFVDATMAGQAALDAWTRLADAQANSDDGPLDTAGLIQDATTIGAAFETAATRAAAGIPPTMVVKDGYWARHADGARNWALQDAQQDARKADACNVSTLATGHRNAGTGLSQGQGMDPLNIITTGESRTRKAPATTLLEETGTTGNTKRQRKRLKKTTQTDDDDDDNADPVFVDDDDGDDGEPDVVYPVHEVRQHRYSEEEDDIEVLIGWEKITKSNKKLSLAKAAAIADADDVPAHDRRYTWESRSQTSDEQWDKTAQHPDYASSQFTFSRRVSGPIEPDAAASGGGPSLAAAPRAASTSSLPGAAAPLASIKSISDLLESLKEAGNDAVFLELQNAIAANRDP